ncbi:hypothetical protein FE257_004615 [Aspergillus nanangensis]|uniref:Ankyrin repeat-containing domain protein n=1 Tax=Aspergillus nanangensis TaxID=2582783 RepID=A0AAD4CYD0_ASPNN|nr:hypothetical protein FE257_004615 [Aspergillus nanangensis]
MTSPHLLPVEILLQIATYLPPQVQLSLLHAQASLATLFTNHHLLCRDPRGNTVLHLLAAQCDSADHITTQLIPRESINVDIPNNSGDTPLMQAACAGNETMARLLLDRTDVDPDHPNGRGITPLWNAAALGREAIVRLFLHHYVNLDATDSDCMSVLATAIEHGHESVAMLLLAEAENSGDLDASMEECRGRSPLSLAAEHGMAGVVEMLLARDDVDVNARDGGGMTPLLWATWLGKEAVARVLLLQGPRVCVNVEDVFCRTPLSYAAAAGSEEIVRLLLEREDIDPEMVDENRCTPLYHAQDHKRTRELFVQRGLTRLTVEKEEASEGEDE